MQTPYAVPPHEKTLAVARVFSWGGRLTQCRALPSPRIRVPSAASALLPRQPFETPAIDRVAVMRRVQIALEAVLHAVDIEETRRLERFTCGRTAVAAAADQQHGALAPRAGKLAHARHEVRIDFPIRAIVPGHMDRPGRVSHEQVFHLASAVDKQRVGVGLQKLVGSARK
ncbi:hypothetical protein PHO31112_00180 [Pandoraea horticolens]|uniref:Uncharacterized protein n=1 Tax=Pandoraea horticolens TaxID=2508298 RepID=A0A5E4RGG4_9BURK|nr:hypothetical protein PHO31112_00180 [Pandoraea horticolens]